MKTKKNLLFFIISILFFPPFLQSHPFPPKNIPVEDNLGRKTFFLSYPRSGTHWFMYSLTFLTNRLCLDNRFHLDIDSQKPYIHQTHNLDSYKNLYSSPNYFNSQKDILILIIRNYKEAMLRNFPNSTFNGILNHIKNPSSYPIGFRYFTNLKYFDLWNPQNRFLIYYEDLLEQPEKVFSDLLKFLKEENSSLKEFIFHLKNHKEYCISVYNSKSFGPAYSKGTDLFYHSKKLTKQQRTTIDNTIKKHYPEYFKKYLRRYEEK